MPTYSEGPAGDDRVPGVDLVEQFLPDGYDALGRLVLEVTRAGWRRWCAARQRRRELVLLRRAFALPPVDDGTHRPVA